MIVDKSPPHASPADSRELALPELSADGSVELRIPTNYVFFRGHFVNAPMLPGVVQLSEIVLPLVRRRHPELGPLRQLRRIRFRRPVLPGETLRVRIGALQRGGGSGPTEVHFELHVGAAVVAGGSLVFGDGS